MVEGRWRLIRTLTHNMDEIDRDLFRKHDAYILILRTPPEDEPTDDSTQSTY